MQPVVERPHPIKKMFHQLNGRQLSVVNLLRQLANCLPMQWCCCHWEPLHGFQRGVGKLTTWGSGCGILGKGNWGVKPGRTGLRLGRVGLDRRNSAARVLSPGNRGTPLQILSPFCRLAFSQPDGRCDRRVRLTNMERSHMHLLRSGLLAGALIGLSMVPWSEGQGQAQPTVYVVNYPLRVFCRADWRRAGEGCFPGHRMTRILPSGNPTWTPSWGSRERT